MVPLPAEDLIVIGMQRVSMFNTGQHLAADETEEAISHRARRPTPCCFCSRSEAAALLQPWAFPALPFPFPPSFSLA